MLTQEFGSAVPCDGLPPMRVTGQRLGLIPAHGGNGHHFLHSLKVAIGGDERELVLQRDCCDPEIILGEPKLVQRRVPLLAFLFGAKVRQNSRFERSIGAGRNLVNRENGQLTQECINGSPIVGLLGRPLRHQDQFTLHNDTGHHGGCANADKMLQDGGMALNDEATMIGIKQVH